MSQLFGDQQNPDLSSSCLARWSERSDPSCSWREPTQGTFHRVTSWDVEHVSFPRTKTKIILNYRSLRIHSLDIEADLFKWFAHTALFPPVCCSPNANGLVIGLRGQVLANRVPRHALRKASVTLKLSNLLFKCKIPHSCHKTVFKRLRFNILIKISWYLGIYLHSKLWWCYQRCS